MTETSTCQKITQHVNTATKWTAITTTAVTYGSLITLVALRVVGLETKPIIESPFLNGYVLGGLASVPTLLAWHLSRSCVTDPSAKKTSWRQRAGQLAGVGICALWLSRAVYLHRLTRGMDALSQLAVFAEVPITVVVPVTGLTLCHWARN